VQNKEEHNEGRDENCRGRRWDAQPANQQDSADGAEEPYTPHNAAVFGALPVTYQGVKD
jgi:hypothetical protein